MIRGFAVWALVLCIGVDVASARSDLPAGNYIVQYSPNAMADQGLLLIKIEHKGGKDVAEMLDPKQAEVESITVDDRHVVIDFKAFGRTLRFDGTVDAKDNKVIIGNFGDDDFITRGALVPTDKEKLDQSDRFKRKDLPEPMTKAQTLTSKVASLRMKLRQAGDNEAGTTLKKEFDDAKKEADEQVPALYNELLARHADSPALIDAMQNLLASKGNAKLSAAEAGTWLQAVDKVSAPHGSRYRLDVLSKLSGLLAQREGLQPIALEAAERAAAGMTDRTTTSQKAKVYKSLRAAQEKSGKADLARLTDAKLAKLEDLLDLEYLAKVPPFKPTKFPGRKEEANRVVVMELFTGAQCPPCVAADAAFDGLLKAYKPSDLVLIQYHMHIPGPDPLTNPSTIARWEYYRKLHERAILGVPTALFNGKPTAAGGGPLSNAEAVFKEFRKLIDPFLDEVTPVKLTGEVTSTGDKLSIKVSADGIKEPGDNIRLRLLLVEESIRYVGGNGIRFHHHVVRDTPGGVDGVALKESKGTASAEVDLKVLRAKLAKYLDDYAANEGEFSNPDRPLALKNLRVMAIVQDDSTGQILQGLQLHVK